MITSYQGKQLPAADDFALLSLRVLWCSDCRSNQLFERPPADAEVEAEAAPDLPPGQARIDGEWACTDCGAAYFDAIDLAIAIAPAIAPGDARHGVA